MPKQPKYAARRDSNEKEIVQALRDLGASVTYLNLPNAPDLLVGYNFETYLFEIKEKKGKLREGQIEWSKQWRGKPTLVVRCLEDALKELGISS